MSLQSRNCERCAVTPFHTHAIYRCSVTKLLRQAVNPPRATVTGI
jgi:hypothetical protein